MGSNDFILVTVAKPHTSIPLQRLRGLLDSHSCHGRSTHSHNPKCPLWKEGGKEEGKEGGGKEGGRGGREAQEERREGRRKDTKQL